MLTYGRPDFEAILKEVQVRICLHHLCTHLNTLGCVWETLALMGARHLISPRWLEEM